MELNLIMRAAGFSVALVSMVLVSSIQAQGMENYNAGLLAAESGDYATAASEWQPLADRGDAVAQFNLGLMYHRGLGVAMSEEKAVSWYQKSAENGYPKAQEFLAAAYREGWFGLPKDNKQASYWEKQLEANTR